MKGKETEIWGEGGRQRETSFTLQMPATAGAGPGWRMGAWYSISSMKDRDSSARVIPCCLPGWCVSRKLELGEDPELKARHWDRGGIQVTQVTSQLPWQALTPYTCEDECPVRQFWMPSINWHHSLWILCTRRLRHSMMALSGVIVRVCVCAHVLVSCHFSVLFKLPSHTRDCTISLSFQAICVSV